MKARLRAIMLVEGPMKKLALSLLLTLPLSSAALGAAGDWMNYGYDGGGTRFSPLLQITPGNVAKLEPAWTFHMDPLHGLAQLSAKPGVRPYSEATPLAVNGIIYLGTPYGRV